MTQNLAQETVTQFQDQGATLLRGFFSRWVEVLRRGIAANIHDPNPTARRYQDADGGGQFFVDYCSWQRIPEYRDFIFN
ncbi:MAG TPA: hypothetical protein DE179_09850 [Oceanospirillaceae bacterium]|nr:hypothetical protein [Oceanospirillaceae bacterium]